MLLLVLSPVQWLASGSVGSRDQVLSPAAGDDVPPGSISLLAKRPHVSHPQLKARATLVGNGTALPNNGRVAFIIRGEAFRNGGRNLAKDSQAGCQPEARGFLRWRRAHSWR